ncbi:nuclear transport factor 2 family protein [Paenibacillus sp. FSL K6-1096]|uniref:nuclear transport factor 2 family protein n=1 Tax=Paenibacillus sp. FSL K6-1096 TaxID=2921460 RepID=UPI0030EF3A12
MEIQLSGMCGNSPKNKLAEDLAVALITGDTKTLTHLLTDDAAVELVGGERSPLSAVLEGSASVPELTALTVEHAISHGKIAAVSGNWVTRGGIRYAFSDHYTFATTKGTEVATARCYRIKLP